MSIWLTQETICQTVDQGVDPSGMGRWTHVRLRGRNGTYVRVYSLYIPTQSDGIFTTFTQQVNVLATNTDSRHPKTALVEDLRKEVEDASEAGDQIIIGGTLIPM